METTDTSPAFFDINKFPHWGNLSAVRKTDLIAGRKKEGQAIPNRVHIKLKLPSDILHEIAPEAVTSTERYGFDGEDVVPSSGLKSIGGGR